MTIIVDKNFQYHPSLLMACREPPILDNSGGNMSSTGGLVANNSSGVLQLETIIVSKERKFPELAFTLG